MQLKRILVLSGLMLLLGGCASGAKMANMVADTVESRSYDVALQHQVAVTEVSGGESTNPLWTSEISNEAFSGALNNSLKVHGLLNESGNYHLQSWLLKVDQPLFGLDLEVTTHVRYLLTSIADGRVILDETLVASHTATMDDAFAAIKRLRLANEGAAKANIEQLLRRLASLQVSGVAVTP